MLEQFLIALISKKTALLSNYPNPFNSEMWIPYQLAKPAEVTLHICTLNGELVRILALGINPQEGIKPVAVRRIGMGGILSVRLSRVAFISIC